MEKIIIMHIPPIKQSNDQMHKLVMFYLYQFNTEFA